MSAAVEHRYERFWDDRLPRHLQKAVEMRRNGYRIPEIADELNIEANSVTSYLSLARRLGVDVPYLHPSEVARESKAVPIARLVHIRKVLRDNGVKRDIVRLIAERVGMTENCVRVRLWRYDKQEGATR